MSININDEIKSSIKNSTTADLTSLDFDSLSSTSYGMLPRTVTDIYFIKCGSYNNFTGFYGLEPLYEELASNIGKSLDLNIVDYNTIIAKVNIEGNLYKTFVSVSKLFGDSYIPIEKFMSINKLPLDRIVNNYKYKSSIEDIILFDFIINQIDRHGRNIEINEDKLAPIFDNSLSFFSKIDEVALSNKLIEESFTVNNFLFTHNLKNNLDYIEK